MRPLRIAVALFIALSVTAAAAAPTPDKKGCADHPLIPTRMPGYFIMDCKSNEFDAFDFAVQQGPKHREEGKLTFITYRVQAGTNEQSGIAVVRNYENAITQAGGTVVASDSKRWVNGKMNVDGREVWVQAESGGYLVWLRIIEKVPMKQHIVADAASFANDLTRAGHVAVYGIYFDTGKALVKPESKPALEEVAKLLKSDPNLKLWVVGHTDSVGKVDDNMRLANARADAVAAELVSAHGIAAARLKGYGVGPLAPIAGNDAEEGRSKNRRVELVKQP
jgi:OmpA-OmpF porin, OOP family